MSETSPPRRDAVGSEAPRQGMRRSLWTSAISHLALLACLQGVGVFFFLKGFFLTKYELRDASDPLHPPFGDFFVGPIDTAAGKASLGSFDNFWSRCISIHGSPGKGEESNSSLADDNAAPKWYPPTHKRVVLLLVDALRFDFALYNSSLADPSEALPHDRAGVPPGKVPRAYFQNGLPVLHKMLGHPKWGKHSRIFKFVADAPTATSQRLKALTSGGLPTFFEISSTFKFGEVGNDNFLYQIKTHNRHPEQGGVVAMGDDTWHELHAKHLMRSFPIPSFDIQDLHSVDEGVHRNFWTEFLDKSDWSLLAAHVLGVDHVGHRHVVDHPAMEAKLSQYNAMISRILTNMMTGSDVDDADENSRWDFANHEGRKWKTELSFIDRAAEGNETSGSPEKWKDTIFLVFGDHGQTADGAHGGNLPDETDSVLFAFSPTPFVPLSDGGTSAAEGEQGLFKSDFLSSFRDNKSKAEVSNGDYTWRRVSQIDIVPTLSHWLGVPIPFGSLGRMIPELMVQRKENYLPQPPTAPGRTCASDCTVANRCSSAWSNHVNVGQVEKYLDKYVAASGREFRPRDHFQRLARVDALRCLLSATKRDSDQKLGIIVDERCVDGAELRAEDAADVRRYAANFDSCRGGQDADQHQRCLDASVALATEDFVASSSDHLRIVADHCRRMWTSFNEQAMVAGAVLAGLVLFACLKFLRDSSEGAHISAMPAIWNMLRWTTFFCLPVVGLWVVGKSTIASACPAFGALIGFLTTKTPAQRSHDGETERPSDKIKPQRRFLGRGWTEVFGAGLLTTFMWSDCYSMQEATCVRFIFSSSLLYHAVASIVGPRQTATSGLKLRVTSLFEGIAIAVKPYVVPLMLVALTTLVRFGPAIDIWEALPGQRPQPIAITRMIDSSSTLISLLIVASTLLLFNIMDRLAQHGRRQLKNRLILRTGILRSLMAILAILCCLYYTVEVRRVNQLTTIANETDKYKPVVKWVLLHVPRLVLFGFLGFFVICLSKPAALFRFENKTGKDSSALEAEAVPQFFFAVLAVFFYPALLVLERFQVLNAALSLFKFAMLGWLATATTDSAEESRPFFRGCCRLVALFAGNRSGADATKRDKVSEIELPRRAKYSEKRKARIQRDIARAAMTQDDYDDQAPIPSCLPAVAEAGEADDADEPSTASEEHAPQSCGISAKTPKAPRSAESFHFQPGAPLSDKKLSYCFSDLTVTLWLWLLAAECFFTSGHRMSFTSIPFSAGYIGVEGFVPAVAFSLVFFHIFMSFIVAFLLTPLLLALRQQRSGSSTSVVPAIIRGLTIFVVLNSARNFSSQLALMKLKRHLMVWSVFAPKFVMDGAVLLFVHAMALLVAMLLDCSLAGSACFRAKPNTKTT